MDAISESRLQLVHPELADKVRKMADMLAVSGIEIRVTQGLRSWADQLNLWLKGRDRDGNVIDPKAVVTNARPGYSWHNFGLAVDVAPFKDTAAGAIPDWDVTHPVWKRIVSVGESLGLVSGSEWRTFPDWPHFQLTGTLPTSPDINVRQTYTGGGILAVWKLAGMEVPQESTNA